VAIILLLPFISVSSKEFDSEMFIADGAVKVFSTACLKYYPDPKQFSQWVINNKFELISDKFSKGLIHETGGKAYSINNGGVRYVLVAEPSNLCTVFVKEANLKKANDSLAKLRSGLKSGNINEISSSNEKQLTEGIVKTTIYDYETYNGRWIMTIVVSESSSTIGFYQFAMSAKSQLRAK